LLALTAVSGIALAQTGNAAPQAPAAKSDKPAQNAPAQTGQTPAQPATPAAPAGKHAPAAKTQEEFKAYQDAAAKPDPVSMEQAANAFAQQYASSELKGPLFQQVMLSYQNANNGDKTVELGRKVLANDPNNVIALVTVASVLSTRTRESDLDKEERLTEAKKDSNRAIELIGSGEGIPAGYPADRLETFKNTIVAMAYASLGQSEFLNNNFTAAEQALRKSTSISGVQPDPITWFQLTLTLDREGKYSDALAAANKCVEISSGHPVNQICQQERDRVQKLATTTPATKPAPATAQPTASTPK
jgi:tetratricopeptide (TPR) repeat protein